VSSSCCLRLLQELGAAGGQSWAVLGLLVASWKLAGRKLASWRLLSWKLAAPKAAKTLGLGPSPVLQIRRRKR